MLRVRAFWEGVPGGPAYLNMYFDGLIADAQGCSTAVGDFLGGIDALQSNLVEWRTDNVVAVMDPVSGDIQDLASVTPQIGAGALSTDILPRATQVLIHWRTGEFQNGREIRGRSNLPYLTEAANQAGGVLATAAQATIQGLADTLVGGVGFSQLIVWSRVSGAIPLVTNAQVNEEFAVLRSRRD